MGLDYSLCAIVHRQNSSSLLPELAKLLTLESSLRLKHLTWKPATEFTRETLIGTTEIDARGIANLGDLQKRNYPLKRDKKNIPFR